jgi:hypothetical protein
MSLGVGQDILIMACNFKLAELAMHAGFSSRALTQKISIFLRLEPLCINLFLQCNVALAPAAMMFAEPFRLNFLSED